MFRFVPFASSSSANAYLIQSGDSAPLLIECGIRFKELMKAMDYELSSLAGCLITHAHMDHARSAKKFYF